jgi:hypothetical protein
MNLTIFTLTILLSLFFSWNVNALSLLSFQNNLNQYKSPSVQTSPPKEISRRTAINTVFIGLSSLVATVSADVNAVEPTTERDIVRSNLLNAIRESKQEEQILNLIEQLVPFCPEYSNDTLKDLDGEWRLIWSANDDFSPLLRLSYPLKPESYQYFGQAAAEEVGEGRVAQGLTGGIFGKKQLWLSSGIKPLDKKGAFEIEPPFRLEFGERPRTSNVNHKKMLVEAINDGDFRKINARTKEAQLAPKNIYEQIYLERNGKGSLRISTITDGDPVIVGAILIHEKL